MDVIPFHRPLTDEEFAQEEKADALQTEMLDRLAKFLLNPELDRCDIADGILADAELIQFLGQFENVMLECHAPRGASWAEIQQDLSYSSITTESGIPRDPLVLPLLLGCIMDEDDRVWRQGSPQEFIRAHEDVQTSNLRGRPMFYAGVNGSMSSEFVSAKENFSDGYLQCFQLC
ncbi:hypothetical protein [Crateriforma conspicua]|uniref:hypothetical protein n=1 Tax=Crateriforma conspicua TaxID=2527996 RepID=UPI00118C063F|nr:hypothetical protein [Crateriforma conspicua]QDV62638.1 hypothetical protein Mal65_17720 [Crateriforma conspicua]